jgi:hypothetical protein
LFEKISNVILSSRTNYSQDVLIYKKKHRPLKVKLMDDTVKTVLVDDSNTVIEITDVVAEKLSLPNSEEYSLARETPEGKTLWFGFRLPFTSLCLNLRFFFFDRLHRIS